MLIILQNDQQLDLSAIVKTAEEQGIKLIGVAALDVPLDNGEDYDFGEDELANGTATGGGSNFTFSYESTTQVDYGQQQIQQEDYEEDYEEEQDEKEDDDVPMINQVLNTFGGDVKTRNFLRAEQTSALVGLTEQINSLVCVKGKVVGWLFSAHCTRCCGVYLRL